MFWINWMYKYVHHMHAIEGPFCSKWSVLNWMSNDTNIATKRSELVQSVRCQRTVWTSSDLLHKYFFYNSLNSEPITLEKIVSQLCVYGAYIYVLIFWCNILKTLLQKGPWSAVAEIRAEFKYLQTFATLQVIKRHVCIVPQCFQLLLVPSPPPSPPPPLSAHTLSAFFCLHTLLSPFPQT